MYRYTFSKCFLIVFTFFMNYGLSKNKEQKTTKDLERILLSGTRFKDKGFQPSNQNIRQLRVSSSATLELTDAGLLQTKIPESQHNRSTKQKSIKKIYSFSHGKGNIMRTFGRRRLLGFDDHLGDISNSTMTTNASSYKFPSDIQTLCPFADFCGLKATHNVLRPRAVSCCMSCYCDEKCKMRGDCCFPENERYIGKHSKNHVCINAATVEPSKSRKLIRIKKYPMIDRCLNNNLQTCKDRNHTPWGALFPVSSSKTDSVYFNRHCALCNGEHVYQEWKIYMICDELESINFETLFTSFDGIRCPIIFEPPDIAGKQINECIHPTVTSCNVTKAWKVYDSGIDEACNTFLAPVHDKYMTVYKNIYCLICNEQMNDYKLLCVDSSVEQRASTAGFTFLLNWKTVSQIETTMFLPAIRSECPEHTVKHPYKNQCRPVLCPFGFAMTPSGCRLHSRIWYKSGYLVEVELDPQTEENFIPVTVFTTGSLNTRNSGSWLNTNGLPLQHFGMFALIQEQNNGSYVKKMIVRLGVTNFPLMIEKIIKIINVALSKPWTMKLNGITYELYATLSKYGISLFHSGFEMAREPLFSQDLEIYKELIFMTSNLKVDYIFTKMNFCSQVMLYKEEFIYDELYRQLKLNLTSTGSGKILYEGEFIVDTMAKQAKICTKDFEAKDELANTAPSFICKLATFTFCTVMSKSAV